MFKEAIEYEEEIDEYEEEEDDDEIFLASLHAPCKECKEEGKAFDAIAECPCCLEAFCEVVKKEKIQSCTHDICTACYRKINQIESNPKCPICRISFQYRPPRDAEKMRPNWRLPFLETDRTMMDMYHLVKEEKRKKEIRKGRELRLYKLSCFQGDFMRRYVYCIEERDGYFYLASRLHL